MSSNEIMQIQIHERITRLEEKQITTFTMINTLTESVEKQGKQIMRAILFGAILIIAGILANGGVDAIVNVLKNIGTIFL